MVAAILSLLGFLLSLYLWLWKIGFIGTLACGTGTCEQVQTSQYATLMGLPVALIGALGYLGLLGVSLLGLQPRWIDRREPSVWLAVLSGLGVAFTAYLSYIEGFVLHAWCRWCLGSAAIIGAIFVTAVLGMKAVSRQKPSAISHQPSG
jgi:uncharacterized membrane protein